jgi:hypothetical protein
LVRNESFNYRVEGRQQEGDSGNDLGLLSKDK